MGKTPGKWIKSLLLGKKSSKSNLKGRDILKSANREESLITSKVSVSESFTTPPLTEPPALEISAPIAVDLQHGVAAALLNDAVNQSSTKEDGDALMTTNLSSQEVPDRIRHEEAATKAQAAFRGYLARRAFRTLKGIIRLQAVIRGHLVRRQAVITLRCLLGIVKFQALARGRRVRYSDIGIQVQKICSSGKFQGANCSLSGVNSSTSLVKLSKNAVIRKVFLSRFSYQHEVSFGANGIAVLIVLNLSNSVVWKMTLTRWLKVHMLLASSPSDKPLCLRYDPGEPNSAWLWLERWMKSRFWEPHYQLKRNVQSKSETKRGNSQTIENEKGMSKRNVRKSARTNIENSSSQFALESEKPKRNPRKVSSHLVDSVQEHAQSDIEKVKRNTRKVPNSVKEASERLEVDNEKPKRSLKKASTSAPPDVSVQFTGDSVDKSTDTTVSVAKQSDVDTNLKLPEVVSTVDELLDHPASDLQPAESDGKIENIKEAAKDINSTDDQISNDNQKASQRRSSLPAKIDVQENGLHSTPKVPSYMAPTESAKAKLRGQGSPRLAHDGIDKNGTTRRHSLPSSTSSKLSSLSPRVPRLVQTAGKGVVRADRSLTSSRDGGGKNL
ncbi:hypothetical protein KPL71_013425 [Citrus sinensis]|uniref:Uncharacterized protein n=1 Tax=Citrus sinensis TaxID=2711 RepID=A0ACB8LKA0_CITSI|nr:hypothetical protein KPL71_013425 [Citrus sinensis]